MPSAVTALANEFQTWRECFSLFYRRIKPAIAPLAIFFAVLFIFSREVGPDLITMIFGRAVAVMAVESTSVERTYFPAGPGNGVPSFSDMTPSATIVYVSATGAPGHCRIVGRNRLFGSDSQIDHNAYEGALTALRSSANLTATIRTYPSQDCFLHSPFTFIHTILIGLLAYNMWGLLVSLRAVVARRES